jgi:hypothetical protein
MHHSRHATVRSSVVPAGLVALVVEVGLSAGWCGQCVLRGVAHLLVFGWWGGNPRANSLLLRIIHEGQRGVGVCPDGEGALSGDGFGNGRTRCRVPAGVKASTTINVCLSFEYPLLCRGRRTHLLAGSALSAARQVGITIMSMMISGSSGYPACVLLVSRKSRRGDLDSYCVE